MKVKVDGSQLSTLDVELCDEIVRSAARWNRNAFSTRKVLVVTTDINDWTEFRVKVPRRYRKALGWCAYAGAQGGHEFKVIWFDRDQTRSCALETVVHELCHAYAGTTISHEQSFRRLCTVATGALFAHEQFSHELEETWSKTMTEWCEHLCARYQRATHANPYESERHLIAARAYLGDD